MGVEPRRSSTMKVAFAIVSLALVANPAAASSAGDEPPSLFKRTKFSQGSSTIGKVVTMLEKMVAESVHEGQSERIAYLRFKTCYCVTETQNKTDSISHEKEEIALLNIKIDDLKASTGKLSTECNELSAAMEDNKRAREDAEAIRAKENAEFQESKADLEQAIAQMTEAIHTLAEQGADQTTEEASASHQKFLAGYKGGASLLAMKTTVQNAMTTASAFLKPEQVQQLQSFVQAAGVGGDYSAQSGQIVGILKNMNDRFKESLQNAEETEKNQLEAHEKFMEEKTTAHNDMQDSYDQKQEQLGSNDENQAEAEEQLDAAAKQQASDEHYLESLLALCKQRESEFAKRSMLRSNEDNAIHKAIAILNTQGESNAFTKVDATTTGDLGPLEFLQLGYASQKPVQLHSDSQRAAIVKVLSQQNSKRLWKVVSLVQAGNPFATVLEVIDKMISLINDEQSSDHESLKWCDGEREKNNKARDNAADEITSLTGTVNELNATIRDPAEGLLAQIAGEEDALAQNRDGQATITKERQNANDEYNADISNLVKSEELLVDARKTLEAYYNGLVKNSVNTGLVTKMHNLFHHKKRVSLMQQPEEETNELANGNLWGKYEGQSQSGNEVIQMLEHIAEETRKEQDTAHKDEAEAQHAFEDAMNTLKEEETKSMERLSDLQATLAETRKHLGENVDERDKTEQEKAAIEKYLLDIKPGCDFITKNIDDRDAHRAGEVQSLKAAQDMIKDTDAYKSAVDKAHKESLGKCLSQCDDEQHVTCKACLAKVTVSGFCTKAPDTLGCEDENVEDSKAKEFDHVQENAEDE